MQLNLSKEWFEKHIDDEDNFDIGAGHPSMCSFFNTDNKIRKNNMDNKMSSRPPTPKSMDDFIAAAEKPPLQKDNLPWLDPGVRVDQKKAYTLHLHEPYILKLGYLSTKLKQGSRQEIARNLLEKGIDNILEQLLR